MPISVLSQNVNFVEYEKMPSCLLRIHYLASHISDTGFTSLAILVSTESTNEHPVVRSDCNRNMSLKQLLDQAIPAVPLRPELSFSWGCLVEIQLSQLHSYCWPCCYLPRYVGPRVSCRPGSTLLCVPLVL